MFVSEMPKNSYILLLLILGLFLSPTQFFAHNSGNKTEMSCCKKESSEKSCCKEKKSKGTKHDCDSSCSGMSCGCPAMYCGFSPMVVFQETKDCVFDFSERKQSYFYSEVFISSDFRSIWLPPKIS